jgi:phosphomannomutase
VDAELLRTAQAWMAADPDEHDRAELKRLLDVGDEAELAERFKGEPAFGTAGIRGPMRAGRSGINTAVVGRVSAGLAQFLGAGSRVVVGFDGRHHSRAFARTCAEVLAGAGCPATLVEEAVPTPLLAFAVRYLSASAGVMITASHNPARDNGLKVYLGGQPTDGSDADRSDATAGVQIAPPTDREIEAAIGRIGTARDRARGVPEQLANEALIEPYLAAVLATVGRSTRPRTLRIAYTPLHGVGCSVFSEALTRAGFPEPVVVPEQAEPDGDFPTVPFPNPEAPGALDLLRALVLASEADLGLASDPDADRCAAVVGDRVLTGDEIGWVIADAVLRRAPGPVATSLVSSTLLPAIAERAGVPCHVTRTGFKWLMRADPDLVFAYEEAFGYAVAPHVVRDKDGISAALLLAEIADDLKQQGRTLLDRLDELAAEFGLHLTGALSVRLDEAGRAADVIAGLHANAPAELAGRPLREVTPLRSGSVELPPDEGVAWRFDDGHVLIRPSGTEPLLKAYLELVRPMATTVADARKQGLRELDLLADAVRSTLEPVAQASN